MGESIRQQSVKMLCAFDNPFKMTIDGVVLQFYKNSEDVGVGVGIDMQNDWDLDLLRCEFIFIVQLNQKG